MLEGCFVEHDLASRTECESVASECQNIWVHRWKMQPHAMCGFLVRNELGHIGGRDAHEKCCYRDARVAFVPLSEVLSPPTDDTDACLLQRFMSDGVPGGLAEVYVSAGKAPFADRGRDFPLYDVRVFVFVEQHRVRYGRGLIPSRVERVCSADELIPVVGGLTFADEVSALVAEAGDEAAGDDGAVVVVGHECLLVPKKGTLC